MEENIKILEEFIKYFEAEAVSTKYRRNISITVGEDDIEALENLIKGYRKLQDRVIKYEKTLENPQKKETIWKSKIKAKIEEVNKSLGYSPVNKILIEQVLQELLGDAK